MNPTFFQQIEGILHSERIDAYRQDGADPALTMGRYTLNMALRACFSLRPNESLRCYLGLGAWRGARSLLTAG